MSVSNPLPPRRPYEGMSVEDARREAHSKAGALTPRQLQQARVLYGEPYQEPRHYTGTIPSWIMKIGRPKPRPKPRERRHQLADGSVRYYRETDTRGPCHPGIEVV